MVVDRSGIHRARKLASTLEHYKDKFELHFLPALQWPPPQSDRSVPDATYKNDLVSPQALSADDAQPEGWMQGRTKWMSTASPAMTWLIKHWAMA